MASVGLGLFLLGICITGCICKHKNDKEKKVLNQLLGEDINNYELDAEGKLRRKMNAEQGLQEFDFYGTKDTNSRDVPNH